MPRQVITYDLMLSSPSDVGSEREIVEGEVALLNRRLRAENIAVSTVRWESGTVPAFGTDPQELINGQLPDYDIFVGILWSRFGTPTPRAGSGTEEEFLEARRRWKKNVYGRPIMLYFGAAAVAPTVDPEQLGRVQAFKKSIGSQALYATFSSSQDFRSQFGYHLDRTIQELHRWYQQGGAPRTRFEVLRQRFEDIETRPDLYHVPADILQDLGGAPRVIAGVRVELSPEPDQLCRGYFEGKLVDVVNGI